MLRDWFNASPENCPRNVQCSYYGNEFIEPLHCCILHKPDENDAAKVAEWVQIFESEAQQTKGVRSDGTYRKIDQMVMYPAAQRIIASWARRCWSKLRGDNTFMSADVFFPGYLQEKLCKRLHVVSNISQLRKLIPKWEFLDEYGDTLVAVCKEILSTFDEVWQAREVDLNNDNGESVAEEVTERILSNVITKSDESSDRSSTGESSMMTSSSD